MLKKANRYLILHQVKKLLALGAIQPTAGNPTFTRKEVSGEEALAFLRELTDAEGYEIFELKGAALTLQTTVVCVKEEEQIAEAIGNANKGNDSEEETHG